jgi:hypothetical protein
MDTVVLFAVAAFLMATGLLLVRLDGRDRTAPPEPAPPPPPEPGSLFHDPWEHMT